MADGGNTSQRVRAGLSLDSLGARYLLFAVLAGAAVVGLVVLLQAQVTRQTAASAATLAAATRVQQLTKGLRDRLWLASFRLHALMMDPRQPAAPVLTAVEEARATLRALAAQPPGAEGRAALAALGQALARLDAEVRRLIELRGDPDRTYPALSVMNDEHLPANRRFAAALEAAIAALEADGRPSARQWPLYRRLVGLRDLWRRTVLAFRGTLVLRTVFEQGHADADAMERRMRALLAEVEHEVAALEAARARGALPLEVDAAVPELRAALDAWRDGLERILTVRRSGAWRADLELLTTRVRPLMAEIFGHLDSLDRAAAVQARAAVARAEAAARRAGALLWAFAVVGLVVVAVGYFYLERRVLGPVREVARALRAGVASGVPAVHGAGATRETRELVEAFRAMWHEVQRRQESLEHQALHDALTGLPNRVLMQDRLAQAIALAERTRSGVAFMLMDLDGFKEVNDTLGHQAGDLLLVRVAERLREVLRRADTVARLGGDEFGLVVPHASAEEAEHVARKVLAALARPVRLEGHNLYVGGSIGIALYPEHGTDPYQLLRHADVAMYQAKRSGRGYAFYEERLDDHSVARLSLLGELREAIHGGGLRLHYQPKVRIADGAPVTVEALARWRHPERGDLQPEEFVPLAEKAGLVQELTRWVLAEALAQCSRWRRRGLRLGVAVNLSVWDLHDRDLPRQVMRALQGFGLPPNVLTLEITESAAMSEPERARAVLGELHAQGVRIAIDDFGTGFSSFAHLKEFPAHELKIDKSFVTDMCHDDDDAVIVRSLVDLGHNLGREVVAEGVEDQDTWDILAILRCDYAQGHHVARPMPAERLATWLRSRESIAAAWAATRQVPDGTDGRRRSSER